jgi:hypothetical protein
VDVVGLRASAPELSAPTKDKELQQQNGQKEQVQSLEAAAQAVVKQGVQAVPLEDLGDVLVYMQVGLRADH